MLLDKLLSNLSVDVEPFAVCLVGRGWRLRLPPPPVPLLHFVLRGEGAVSGSELAPIPVAPSWLVVVPPGVRHALQSAGPVEHEQRIDAVAEGSAVCQLVAGAIEGAAFVVACGLVKVRYGSGLNLFAHLKEPLAADLSGAPPATEAFRRILAEQAGRSPGSSAMTKVLMTECLVHFFRKIAPAGSLPWLDALEDARLGRALDRILEDPSARHTVESLAAVASMSRSVFAQKFTAAFGQPPMALVQQVRMQHAAHLLRGATTLSIDEVAERSGYASRSHFSAAFVRRFGISPSGFRTRPA